MSVILPACNEARGLRALLPVLTERYPDAEIIVVDDGSTDDSLQVVSEYGVKVISHPYRKGNGASVKSGARCASGDMLVFMDADGQHEPADIERLLTTLDEGGYDMVVGARQRTGHANRGRWLANAIYNWLAGWIVGRRIDDLTSGFRAVRADYFNRFLYLLPNGFSYPTTVTMAFFRAGYSVAYVPIRAASRAGESHVRPVSDGVRFLMIIFRIGSLYSPLRVFFPVSLFFFLAGIGHYGYTFFTYGRFTNMSVLLLVTSVVVFLMGLVSEQISALMYRDRDDG